MLYWHTFAEVLCSGFTIHVAMTSHQRRPWTYDAVTALNNFMQRQHALVDQILWYAGLIKYSRVLRVDVGAVIKSGEYFLKLDGANQWHFGLSIA